MTCPNCGGRMREETLAGRLATTVTIDLCLACQAFWFDGYESLRLAPASVLSLFRVIGETMPARASRLGDACACPRCAATLALAHDLQRATRFEYLRCPAGHGRLVTFYNFLREKDFIRPLSSEQLAELARNVQSVNCANCGAPVNLAAGSTCAHCGSPLSMIDMRQAHALVAELQQADAASKTVDPALPLTVAHARHEVEATFASFERESGWYQEASSAGLVGAGLAAIARWLKTGG